MVRIVALGDSICYGDGVRPDEAWLSLMGASLSRERPDCVELNAGVNGYTALGGLRRLPPLLRERPDLFYAQFGLNDAWQAVALEHYLGPMRAIVRQALESGAGAVLVGLNHAVCLTAEQRLYGGEAYSAEVRRFNAALRAALAPLPERLGLVDLEQYFADYGGLEEQAALLQADGVHLSGTGNAAYAGWLAPVFRARLGRPPA